ncbi:MAG: aminoglycoside phosphotransferase family protein [Aestuariibacter sp.]
MDTREQQLQNWINQATDFQVSQLRMVSGDASFRRYFRFASSDSSIIAVDAPPTHENNEVFINVANAYRQAGIKVPEVLDYSLEQGFMLLQDFGDHMFASAYDSDVIQSLYQKALSALPALQSVQHTAMGELPLFDDALLDAEFHLFNHWLIDVHLGLSLTQDTWQVIHDAQKVIRQVFLRQPQVGVHRDYHSRNLMLLGTEDNKEIGIIDFQDAVIGPVTYDAVSLLRDCYIVWPETMVYELLAQWHQQYFRHYQWQDFQYWFDIVGIQRHIKASGIFCRLCHRDGKQGYLEDIPRTLEYIVKYAAKYPELQAFSTVVTTQILPAMQNSLVPEV